jgi:hypothetical protein
VSVEDLDSKPSEARKLPEESECAWNPEGIWHSEGKTSRMGKDRCR